MKNQSDKPYLDKPSQEDTTKEQMIYGGGETLKELEEQKKKGTKVLLTE